MKGTPRPWSRYRTAARMIAVRPGDSTSSTPGEGADRLALARSSRGCIPSLRTVILPRVG